MSQDTAIEMDKLGEDLSNAGLKSTLPRLRILKILEESSTRHMSAEDVYDELRKDNQTVSLATIYRVLSQFVDAGLAVRHQFEGNKAIYELNDDEHHDHMVCLKCGKIIEFMDEKIELLQKQIAEEHEFEMQDHSLTLFGICKYPDRCKQQTR
ncbi:MAG: ferric iron uptake transcriptional regulator [Gammaproteobacteria bacterium]|nr:ferric iron uptake transcriptional regulator [Gammaproteobacteria bacterium]MCY4219792.1 ferric iron uptake transcriptional regulator [Gammaproteobacteria bacterium]MCY4275208.1 ferric iron uptake transcriptional regulator [Gammaproteobacteria bacterium]